ncbi:MAG: FmdB family transcriptional regulator [Microbacterium sp.]|jgi:putative FmdB family regulatory protein|uniref:FmdB family zinc ribbon protein n=1 Tax=unclassified Microbacterium TaxID=2609290 RepID=UPI00109CF3EA|nr:MULTISPECIES: FmdB family zinc ribbon protein [unclassified Microbacterium]MDF2507883.1 FmdB family transcriptional regulator [Microbacterium sp.]
MPTYAYACTSCGHKFDAVQSFADDALTVCPECGGQLRKQYGSIGVTFNGSGFYRTDSRAKSGGSSDASTSSKTESTTSAKPAAASTPASS